jgi:hypothetical protein
MTTPETGTCALCGDPFDHFGNNPEPVLPDFDMRVCDGCNTAVVLPTRLGLPLGSLGGTPKITLLPSKGRSAIIGIRKGAEGIKP